MAVVRGHWRDYRDFHPSAAALVVEVADTTLLYDGEKGAIYARAGIPEYWILNRIDACLEAYREPRNGAYLSRTILKAGDSISPLACPEASILVANLLP